MVGTTIYMIYTLYTSYIYIYIVYISINTFFCFFSHTYICQYTYLCTCVVCICLHLCLHTSHACKHVHICMSWQDAIYTQLCILLCSLTCVHIHVCTCFDHRCAIHHNTYQYVCSHVMAHSHTINV